MGLRVQDDAAKALKAARPDIVVHCTSSLIRKVMPQIETILKSKTAIVSTTEELAYPGYTHVSFRVRSISDAVRSLETNGIAITEGPINLGGEIAVFIRDPDGNVVELAEIVRNA